jgi:hypothetical protein
MHRFNYTFKHVHSPVYIHKVLLCTQPHASTCCVSTIDTLYNFHMYDYLNHSTNDLFTILFTKYSKAQSYCLLFITTKHPCSFLFHHFTPAFSKEWRTPSSSYYVNKTSQILLHRVNHASMAFPIQESINIASHLTYSGTHTMPLVYIYSYIIHGHHLHISISLLFIYLILISSFSDENLQSITWQVSQEYS